MLDLSRFDAISETYEVEKTVEIVMEVSDRNETLRFEALKHIRDDRIRYCTRVAILTRAPVDTADNANIGAEVWSSYSAPWIDEDSADAAIIRQLALMQRAQD